MVGGVVDRGIAKGLALGTASQSTAHDIVVLGASACGVERSLREIVDNLREATRA
jgi:hypothetical protein